MTPTSCLTRRQYLLGTASAAVALMTGLPGCAPAQQPMRGTFVQPWIAHQNWSKQNWLDKCQQMKMLGATQLTVQWVGQHSEELNWRLSDESLKNIFDVAEELELKIRLGLPYDTRWWKVLQTTDPTILAAFLQTARVQISEFIRQSRWQVRPAFVGWYIPYEIEQYSWGSGARISLLTQWLHQLVDITPTNDSQQVAISTYHSALHAETSLSHIWESILTRVPLRPMIQDGVGVEGLANYAMLVPLGEMLKRQAVNFDLIIELFEQEKADHLSDITFKAHSASMDRIREQLKQAQRFGAENLVSFSLDPWVIGDTPEAKLLLKNWAV
jgi:hypothetical protein